MNNTRYRNTVIFIIALGVVVTVLVVTGFVLSGGTPVSQKDIRKDETRVRDFQTIQREVKNYTREEKSLPESLDDLNRRVQTIDSFTSEPYTYTVTDETTYQLCTTFDTDWEEAREYSSGSFYYENQYDHEKGYDCIEFEVPEFMEDVFMEEVSVSVDDYYDFEATESAEPGFKMDAVGTREMSEEGWDEWNACKEEQRQRAIRDCEQEYDAGFPGGEMTQKEELEYYKTMTEQEKNEWNARTMQAKDCTDKRTKEYQVLCE